MQKLWFETLISSCGNSRSSRHGPCSSTTTRNPAVDSSFATTPPAAPEPTTTKSTSSVGLYLIVSRCSGSSGRCRWSCMGIVPAEGSSPGEAIVESDQLPARLVRVPAVFGIGEHPRYRAPPQHEEERALVLFHRRDDVSLLLRAQARERRRARNRHVVSHGTSLRRSQAAGALVELVQSRHKGGPLIRGPRREALVEEVDDAGFVRARCVVRRNDL